jgi:hypothetical protein
VVEKPEAGSEKIGGKVVEGGVTNLLR